MIGARSFVILITLFFGAGFVWPLIHKTRSRDTQPLALAVRIALSLAFVGSVIGIWAALPFLFSPGSISTETLLTSSWLPDLPALRWEGRLDALSAFFILMTSAFSAAVAVYSFGALRAPHYREQAPRIAAAFNLFVWATMMVVVANDSFSLLVALEIMTLAFAFLATYKHNLYLSDQHNLHLYDEKQQDTKRKNAWLAPQVYLIISHTSTAFLLVALLLLAIEVGSLSFEALRAKPLSGNTPLATIIFFLTVVGLGMRAGLVPAHFWVPLVHPASPTTTHALSLGIAIKVAVYLMYRFFFQFMAPETWWGYVVLTLAVITALVNVWYAIASHDLKEALAYHSIENIGIMTAGIGVALIFAPQQGDISRWVAALALVASLYHLLNHAVFKGLLYLCTGAIDNLTGQVVEFDRLGGLIKLFPRTSALFLVGAAAISGFPPLNGFISEWLTLQALLKGIALFEMFPRSNLLVLISSLVFLVASFALTAFCFYKIVGLTLLGLPRTSHEERRWAREEKTVVPRTMRWVMGLMALLCLFLGLFPALVINNLLSGVTATILSETVSLAPPSWTGLQLLPPPTEPGLSPELLAELPPELLAELSAASIPLFTLHLSALFVFLTLGAVLSKRLLGRRRQAVHPEWPWNCGTPYDSAQMQYTGAALSFLIRDRLTIPLNFGKGVPGYLPTRLELSHSTSYPQVVVEYFRVVYNRLYDWLRSAADKTGDKIQNGDVRRYLLYIFIANWIALALFYFLRRGSP